MNLLVGVHVARFRRAFGFCPPVPSSAPARLSGPVSLVAAFLLAMAAAVCPVRAADVPAATAGTTAPRQHITVGSELDYPPFAIVTDGHADGYSVDLMKAVCAAMNIDVTFRVGPWAEIRAALAGGELDALPLVSYSKERDEVFDFTVPHTVANGIVFKRKDSPPIRSTGDLRDKAIVVMRADAAHDWLVRNDVSENLILTDTVGESLEKLAAGTGDYALAPRLVGLLTAKELNLDNIEPTGPLIDAYGRGYGFAVKQGNAALLAKLNEGLAIIKANGTYDDIYDKWFGVVDPRGVPAAVILRNAAIAAGIVVAAGILVLVWIVVLRRTVRKQTVALQTAYDDVERQVVERTRELNAEIAERARVEENLRRSEGLRRQIVETAPDLVWLKDTEGVYLACNRMFGRFFGAAEAEIVGKTDYDFVDKELADFFRAHDRAAMEADGPSSNEEQITFADDGHAAWLETTKTPMRDADGRVIGVLGIGRDITLRKQAEDALRDSEERYRNLFDTMLNGFAVHEIILDGDGAPCDYRFLEINPAFEKMTGLSEAVIGKTVREVIPDIEDDWIERYGRVALTGRPDYFEDHSGSLGRSFEVYAYSPRKGQFATIFSDITERTKAEETLRKSEALLTEMGRAGQIGGWEHDLRTREATWTEETYRIVEIPEGRRPPGPDEHLAFYHPDDRPVLAEAYRKAVEEGKPFDLELRCNTATGRPFWCRAIGHPVIEDGVCVKMFGAFQDITERKSMERQVAHAQKMEAVGQLTGGLAHDLNNVLGIILMNVEMLNRKVQGIAGTGKHAEYIVRSVHRAADLVRKLLDYSRTEVHEVQRVSVNDFIHEMEGLIAKSLTPAIELKLALSGKPWSVDIDPGDFEAALLNLALNARDAMPDGGRLVIETENRTIDSGYVEKNPGSSAGEFVMVAVGDTGTGMEPEVAERVLEPFFTTKEVGKGTGLGLSMVYGFVQRSGGHMKIYSEPGHGTSVHLYLPHATEAAAQAPAPPAHVDVSGGDETVLVVDDEPALVDVAVSILEMLGYRTLAAEDARAALDILDSGEPVDLLFTDVIMPGGMDGYHLAMAARERRPSLRVLLTSGFTRKREEFVNGEAAVAADLARTLLHKPYTSADLAAAVREALDRET